MNLLEPNNRWLRSGVLGLGLGFIAGGLETLSVAMRVQLGLGLAGVFKLGAVAMLFGGALGLVCGLLVGRAFQRRWAGELDSRAYSACMAGTALLIACFYQLNAALALWGLGRGSAAFAAAMIPVGVAGIVWFNATYWFRKEEIGAEYRLGWRFVSPMLGLALVGVAAALQDQAPASGASGPNVLFITIDTLRRDHVGVYGSELARTPNIDKIGEEGIIFDDAITPTPETAPSHAAMMTSLHPLRHRVLSNGDALSSGFDTLAERLSAAGYATGAFLSSIALEDRVGLDQGFSVYNDDFNPILPGLGELLITKDLVRIIMITRQPQRFPWLLERDGAATTRLAADWIRARGDAPWFAWVHLFEPHAPYEAPGATVDHRALLADPNHVYTEEEATELRLLYALEVERADADVGALMALLDELGLKGKTLVIVVADHGEQLGEHGVQFHHHGLWEQSLRVPLVVRTPTLAVTGVRVPQQVRVMDLGTTVLEALRLAPFNPTEGVDIFGFVTGKRRESLPCDLFGRRTADISEGCLFGYRTSAEQGAGAVRIKYIVDPGAGDEQLYDLDADPEEQNNLHLSQPEAAAMCRARVSRDLAGSPCGGGQTDAERLQMLQALGYIDRGSEAPQ